MLLRTLIIAITLFAPLWAESAQKPFEILQPADESVFEESFVSVVIKINDPAINELTLYSSETNTTRHVKVEKSKRDVYCETMPLHLGDTTLKITAVAAKNTLQKEELYLFHRSDVFEGCDTEPSGYEKRFFHNEQQEAACVVCHNMKITPKSYEPQENVKESQCYTCHKELLSRRNSHAPSVNWVCMECHDGSVGEHNIGSKGASKLLAPDPVMKRCFNCHENIEQNWNSRTSEHGPTKSGRCNRCHNPHSSDHEFFLRKGIWDLCTTCHSEKATGTHVIGGFVYGSSHPTQGRPDPARPGRELVCSGCHNPHGSNGIFLLRTTGKTRFSVCQRCHDKR